jgi:tetratricopeptide (TPR) repeat protein
VAQEWIAKEPASPEALFYAGVAEEHLGDLAKANQYFQKVLSVHPNHVATMFELGLMANRAGKTDEVEKMRVALKAIDGDLDAEFTEALKPATTQ